MDFGRLELIVGPMYSGKSSELIRRIKRFQVAGASIQVFKYDDKRYFDSKLSSHDLFAIDAFPVKSSKEIEEKVSPSTQVVAIDEIHFFDDSVVDLCVKLADSGKTVIATGLNQSFRAEPFPFSEGKKSIADLMALSDDISFLNAVCTFKEQGKPCNKPATRTQRLINGKPAPYNSPIVLIGAKDFYEARCRLHHKIPGKNKEPVVGFEPTT